MPNSELFSIMLKSDNEALNKAYKAYLDAKEELEKCLYYEGITVEIKQKDTASDTGKE